MRWTMAAACVSGSILSLVLAYGVWAGGGRTNAVTGRPFLHDQLPFHAAGDACRTGHCSELYDEASQRAFQRASFGGGDAADFRPYLSPPHTALLYVPASILPFALFVIACAAANLALLFAALRLLGARPAALLAAFGFYPVFDGFAVGQSVFASLFLFAAALTLWRKDRGFLAGVTAGLIAAYKPHLLCGVGLLWLLEARRDYRPLLGMLCSVGAFAIVDLAFLAPQARSYAGWMIGVLTGGGPLWAGMTPGGEFTLEALFVQLLPGATRAADVFTIAAVMVGVVAFVGFWRRHRGRPALMYAAALVLTLWLAPHAHRYEWTLLVLPGAVLWQELPAQRPRLAALYAAFYVVAALAIRVARWQLDAIEVALHPAMPALALGAAIVAAAIDRRLDRGSDLAP